VVGHALLGRLQFGEGARWIVSRQFSNSIKLARRRMSNSEMTDGEQIEMEGASRRINAAGFGSPRAQTGRALSYSALSGTPLDQARERDAARVRGRITAALHVPVVGGLRGNGLEVSRTPFSAYTFERTLRAAANPEIFEILTPCVLNRQSPEVWR
jgi:hypothetical protein